MVDFSTVYQNRDVIREVKSGNAYSLLCPQIAKDWGTVPSDISDLRDSALLMNGINIQVKYIFIITSEVLMTVSLKIRVF